MAYLPNRGKDFPRGVASYVSPVTPRTGLGDNPLIDGMRSTDDVVSRTAMPDNGMVSPIDISLRKNSVGSKTFLSIGKGNVRPYTAYQGQQWSNNSSGLSGFFDDVSNAFSNGNSSSSIDGSSSGNASNSSSGTVLKNAIDFFGGLFGKTETTEMPQKPVARDFAAALANKWVTYYADAPQDVSKWTNEIAADGPERAWVNFATPYNSTPRSKGGVRAATLAVQLFDQIGSPYEVNKGQGFQGQTSSTQPPAGYGTTFSPYGVTGSTTRPLQAGVGSMSTATLLIVAAGILGAVVVMNRKPSRS